MICKRIYKVKIKDKEEIKKCEHLAFLSRRIYNRILYIYKQGMKEKFENIIGYEDVYNNVGKIASRMKDLNEDAYLNIPVKDNISYITKNIQALINSYWGSVKSKKVKHKVHFPSYDKDEDKNAHITFRRNSIKEIKGKKYLMFPQKTNLKPIRYFLKENEEFRTIDVKCINNVWYYIITYEKTVDNNIELDRDKYLSIDLGVNNLVTACCNNGEAFIINGRHLKSINHFWNKTKAKLQCLGKKINGRYKTKQINSITNKRNKKVNYEIHCIAKNIINKCIQDKIGNIVIGYNKGWKNKSNMSKRDNQNFVQLPFSKLINNISYLAEENNIKIITIVEAYTSKCDSLAKETIEKHKSYLGRRIKRGLFKSSTGNFVNADVNGSANIMRLTIGDDFINNMNKDKFLAPYKINCF